MRRSEITSLKLPAGKIEHCVPDGTVPGLALRLRENSRPGSSPTASVAGSAA
jgi:hypothetical protein